MKDLYHYSLLAEMFSYPSEKLKTYAGDWRNIVDRYDPELAGDLDPFVAHINSKSIEYQQEYFVSTFDVQPLCCLDTGYVLFGEDYRRGQFMANLKTEHKTAGNDCGTELPDHLPVLLRLLPKLSDADLAEELIFSLLAPALNEMVDGFSASDNHYKGLLRIVAAVMERDYPASRYERFRLKKVRKNRSRL